MKLKHFLLTALILFTGASGVYAGRRYVGFSADAPDGQNYSNNTQLQTALTAAESSRDTVFVATGLYIADATEFNVPAGVTLIGGYARGDIGAKTRRYPGQFVPFDSANLSTTTKFTILDGNSYKRTLASQKHRVVTVNAGGVVDGCLIRNGHVRNKNGGGVLLNGGKLYNSIVRGNVAMNHPDSAEALGGGVFIQQAGELINCLVAYNMANDGYGVAAGTGGGKMINNTITANTYSPVYAKIPGGTFNLYKGNSSAMPCRPNGDIIPKWEEPTQGITLNDFYISRILTTEGQYAVFCAAMDIPKSGDYGQLDMTVLKGLTEPIKGVTIDTRYNFSSVGSLQNILLNVQNADSPGLRYDDGVWHPVVDTATVEYPVGNVTWYGALAYSVWLGGGLPSEAQWQFAARREPNGVNDNLYSGAYGSLFSASDGKSDANDTATWRILDTIAWVAPKRSIDIATGKLGATWANRPHEVARKRPNAMGIYDMTGNIWEWLGDWCVGEGVFPYGTYPTDPIRTTISNYRTMCGGGYSDDVRGLLFLNCRYQYISPITAAIYTGFRPIVAF